MTGSEADKTKRTRVRWLIILVLFIITTINYADRATFSIAGQSASKELGLDPVAMGYILSAFAWAYVLGQIPGGALLDKFGSKKIYTDRAPGLVGFTDAAGLRGLLHRLMAASRRPVRHALRRRAWPSRRPSPPTPASSPPGSRARSAARPRRSSTRPSTSRWWPSPR
jgi:hypothetical protein